MIIPSIERKIASCDEFQDYIKSKYGDTIAVEYIKALAVIWSTQG